MQTIVLDATTKTLVAKMAGAVTTTNPDVVAAWADDNGTTFVEGGSDTALNGTASVTLVAAPAASTRRVIKTVSIQNRDTVANTITISYNDNGTLRQIAVVTLQPGDVWTTDGTFDNNGNLKAIYGAPSLIISTTVISGATNGYVLYNNNGVLGQIQPTGTGLAVLQTNPAITNPTITTAVLAAANTANLGSTSTGWAHLYMTSAGVLDFANGNVVLTHSTGILLMGTGELRITTPGTNSASVPTLGSTSTLTNKTLTAPVMTTPAATGIGTADLNAPNVNAITVSTNAGTASASFLVNTFTNSSAAAMTITLPTSGPTPKSKQFLEVCILDFSAVAQGITWVNTENSTVTAPTTSNGSTTLPLSVLFQWNAGTSKWRCVASS